MNRSTPMHRLSSVKLLPLPLLLVLLMGNTVKAASVNYRASLTAILAENDSAELLGTDPDRHWLHANQQSLRLMLEHRDDHTEVVMHLRARRLQTHGVATENLSAVEALRYRELSMENGANTPPGVTSYRAEIDWLMVRHQYKQWRFSAGRQAIDWGSGRFWQPFNVFGAFQPTDLDTEYKPGIDSVVVDWYPSPFSSLTAVYAFAPTDQPSDPNTFALHYRTQVGEVSEAALMSGEVRGQRVNGVSFGSEWFGWGWRVETLHRQTDQPEKDVWFWIAGADYQFENGSVLSIEWHDNRAGAQYESDLATILRPPSADFTFATQRSRHVLGAALSKQLSPLWQGQYLLLTSSLKDADHQRHLSLLHQFSALYSLGDNSTLQLAVLSGQGRGTDRNGTPRSEFGDLPLAFSFRLTHYF